MASGYPTEIKNKAKRITLAVQNPATIIKYKLKYGRDKDKYGYFKMMGVFDE